MLGPDEAQYWTWSQKLAIGYYSKPPFIAWQIWLGTVLVGDIEFGVRIVSVIISLLQVALIYELAISMKFSAKAAFWSACLMAFTPLGFFGGYFALTDGGMLLCWTLASILVVKAIERQKFASPWALGFVVLLGSLFKWSIYLIWGVIFLFLHFFTTVKNWKGKFFLAFFISLFGLLPSLIWNMEHDFATFRHTTAIVTGGHADVKGLFLAVYRRSSSSFFTAAVRASNYSSCKFLPKLCIDFSIRAVCRLCICPHFCSFFAPSAISKSAR